MPKSYSNDLRKKVIECINAGSTYKEASVRFMVSHAAVGKWYKKYKDEGSYEHKSRGGSKRKIDLEKLKEYAESNPDMKLKDAAKEFGFSIYTISWWLKKIGFSYKKKRLHTWKQAKNVDKNT